MLAKFEWPAIHHAITHNQHNTTKNKNTNSKFSPTAGFQRLYFIGECDCRVLQNWSQSTQHGNAIFIDETNIFFILLTIILQVLDWHTHKLKVSYFSDYLLFFLTNASKQCALTVFIHQYFNLHCPLSPGHVSAWFWTKGGAAPSSPCFRAHTGTTVGKIARCC
jgi:hypothetical protein